MTRASASSWATLLCCVLLWCACTVGADDGADPDVSAAYALDGPPALQVSTKPDRSGAVLLDSAALWGNAYVFLTGGTSTIGHVDFYRVDSTDSVLRTESYAPWDFGGTAADGSARPYDFSVPTPGQHTIRALVHYANGATASVSASFSIGSLLVSDHPDRSSPRALNGATIASGSAHVFELAEPGIASVTFTGPGAYSHTEKLAPYDYAGVHDDGTAIAATLPSGTQTISASVVTSAGAHSVTATFTVQGAAPATSPCSGLTPRVGGTRGGLLGFANGYRYGQLGSSDRDRYMGVYADEGVKWFRMNMEGWNLAEFQDVVTRAKAHGICVFGNLAANASGTHWADPPDHQAWANAAASMVKQLKADVHVWEIWNEQNLGGFWPSPNPASYADLLHKTYLAIKAVDPNAVVLGGGCAPEGGASDPNNAVNFWKSVYAWNRSQGRAGSQGLFDGLAHHPYHYPGDPLGNTDPGNAFWQTYLLHANVMCNSSYGGPSGDCTKRIWGTEGGFPTECSDSYCVSLSDAAAWIPRMMDRWMNDWGSFTGPFMFYQVQNQPGQTGHELHMGFVRGDWSRKDPMYISLKTYSATP